MRKWLKNVLKCFNFVVIICLSRQVCLSVKSKMVESGKDSLKLMETVKFAG